MYSSSLLRLAFQRSFHRLIEIERDGRPDQAHCAVTHDCSLRSIGYMEQSNEEEYKAEHRNDPYGRPGFTSKFS